MTKTKLIVMGAGILGSIMAAAVATGVGRDAVDAFCSQAKVTPAAVTVPAPADAGAP